MAVVVSLIAGDLDWLRRAAERQARFADLVELRLDRIGNPGREALEACVAAVDKPLIATCKRTSEGGDFEGSTDELLELLHTAAEAGFNFVDVDARLSLDLGEVPGKCHRIVSRHDLEGTPEDLALFHEEVVEVLYEGDLIKLVTHARTTEDGLRMLRLVREVGGGLIGFCSGEAGSFTRVLAPIMGSPFTFAAPAALAGQPIPERTAPGQLRVGELRAALPPGGVNPNTAIFGIVGNPVGGSWSPRVHGMTLKAAKLDAVYVSFEPTDFAQFLALATDPNYRGFSVTAPFKADAFRLAKTRDGTSEAVGAANTLIREGEHWRAANTDVAGARETLEQARRIHEQRTGREFAEGSIRTLVLGTGGAARAAIHAARVFEGPIAVAGRDAEKTRALAAELGVEAVELARVADHAYDVLVHTTTVGSLAQPDEMVVSDDAIRPDTIVLDAVYRPLKTPLLRAAHARGCTAVPGGEWFVRQAGAQFRLFTGADPDEGLMRAAFEHALEEDS